MKKEGKRSFKGFEALQERRRSIGSYSCFLASFFHLFGLIATFFHTHKDFLFVCEGARFRDCKNAGSELRVSKTTCTGDRVTEQGSNRSIKGSWHKRPSSRNCSPSFFTTTAPAGNRSNFSTDIIADRVVRFTVVGTFFLGWKSSSSFISMPIRLL